MGLASYFHLGVDRFPAVDLPTVRVMARLAGASPTEIESQVAQPIEESLNTIEGIKELQSISGAGMAGLPASPLTPTVTWPPMTAASASPPPEKGT